ncbi:acyl-CoA thioesterase [Shimia sagamensis]|uniref:Acyl-CoA thioesterase FadM n=1 Tax=Shimia sagamensis TaxID=1566352 RepID=A0ABY1NFW6_9RHOB|nr:acyl-CoA thioesterase [Shimia sagamensis]SMP08049.1 Acyl-CoA thioesterase FadM [Shimia sagamensis]
MYPIMRMVKELIKFRNASHLPLTGTHVSAHRCWPSDIDLWMELNNGRTLTLFDLGRIPLAQRIGLVAVLRRKKWSMTMAGTTVRYRRRIRTFEKVEMRSRAVFWDKRFIYLEQSMWKQNGECANHALYRAAVTDKAGIVTPDTVLAEMGNITEAPEAPEWVANWIAAETTRPWPPMQD